MFENPKGAEKLASVSDSKYVLSIPSLSMYSRVVVIQDSPLKYFHVVLLSKEIKYLIEVLAGSLCVKTMFLIVFQFEVLIEFVFVWRMKVSFAPTWEVSMV